MRTEAAILVDPGKPLVLAELEIPPLGPGQALVEIAYSGVCGTQVMEWRGEKGEDPWLPHCLGHEGTGTVLDVGAGVAKVKPGDTVVLSWIRGEGAEAGGAVYRWEGQTVNAGGVTTFQRHAVVSENRLSRLPSGLPLDMGVLLGCAAPTGMGAVINVLRLAPGEAVAILGAGGVGLCACMAAAFSDAASVIAVDPAEGRRALARRLGASCAIDPKTHDLAAEIREAAPQGLDAAVEATGVPSVMEQALALVRPRGGRAVLIGNARAGATLTLSPGHFNAGKSLLGTWGGDAVPERDFPRYAELLASVRFPVRDLLSPPYALADVDRALADLAAGRVGRPLIDMRKS